VCIWFYCPITFQTGDWDMLTEFYPQFQLSQIFAPPIGRPDLTSGRDCRRISLFICILHQAPVVHLTVLTLKPSDCNCGWIDVWYRCPGGETYSEDNRVSWEHSVAHHKMHTCRIWGIHLQAFYCFPWQSTSGGARLAVFHHCVRVSCFAIYQLNLIQKDESAY
jgi:hypothetical protein